MRSTSLASSLVLLVLCVSGAVRGESASPPGPAAAGENQPVDYSRDIRPLLSNSCYACHGPDASKRKAKLRLDLREEAVKSAILPGKGEESDLYLRIVSTDPHEAMPPTAAKKPRLTAQQADTIRRWIDQGAKFDMHWAYVKPVKAAAPQVKNAVWVRNAIDAFIAASLEREGFSPAAEADRITLLRRLSFDLTGLPPTPAEVDAFVLDQRADAFERQVDRLLASPHFGERLAIYWLDLVRYADTIGYHSDTHRNISLYRDYVIAAFNTNKRFDQFTIEQLAGDLLPTPNRDQVIASGYNRLLMTTEEGGAQAREYQAKYSADRVRNVSGVWMAGTMGCCECHDHKFDPYTMRDFYSLASFFTDVQEVPVGRQPETPVPTAEQEAERKRLEAQLASLKQQLTTPTPALAAAQKAWESRMTSELSSRGNIWQIVKPDTLVSRGKAKLALLEDQSVLNPGPNAAKDIYTVTFGTELKAITGLRLEALTHPSLSNKSLSLANGNFVLTGIEVSVAGPGGKPELVKIAAAEADFQQDGFPIAHAIDASATTGWAVEGHVRGSDHKALFVFARPLAGGPGTVVTVKLKHESIHTGHNIGRFRLGVTSQPKPGLEDSGLPTAVVKALRTSPDKRTATEQEALATHYRSIAPELAPLRDQVANLESTTKKLLDSFPKTLVSMKTTPRMLRILSRGNWLDDKGPTVAPAIPAFLGSLETKERATRLDLANWLVSRDNPITARVFVNRLWKLCFGHGLVKSVDDFGAQGTTPSHPELLDWLALEFVDSGWNIKHVLKLMVTSATYRQSSVGSREQRERDPANRWLARQGRYRLEAEMVRDNALAVSGLLVRRVGGPSVKPYQPAGYWAFLNFPKREWQKESDDNQYRRGLYTYWCRTFLHPSMVAFDASSREESCAERPRSSTPLQALVLLNDPCYVEAARVFGARILREGGADSQARMTWAFRQALCRSPKTEELAILLELLRKHQAEYSADKDAAKQLLGVGDAPAPKEVDVAELAAWTSAARTILNLHEAITRN